jgi:hypothetical protein
MDQEPGIPECWIENIDDHPLQPFCNSLDEAGGQFIDDIQIAYDRYADRNDWVKLADEIWESCANYIGFRDASKPKSADEEFLIQQFRKSAKKHFKSAIEGSFGEFYTIPKDQAIQELTLLEDKLRANRDFDTLFMSLTEDMRQKVDFLISRIQEEIHKQEFRVNKIDELGSKSEKTGVAEDDPPFNNTRQSGNSRTFIRRHLTMPDSFEGSQETYIKTIYREWRVAWVAELTTLNGSAWVESKQADLLKQSAFRDYFMQEKKRAVMKASQKQ